MTPTLPLMILRSAEWTTMAHVHAERVQCLTGAAKDRRARGLPHPIEDFLFQYYSFPFALLENWQPGVDVGLEWTGNPEAAGLKLPDRYYRTEDGVRFADKSTLGAKDRERLGWMLSLMEATANRPPNFACHGLHEWAMVYRGKEVRHESTTPLRLPQAEIDAVVESRPICCSHHDAFRFFVKEARPLNRLQPSLETREDFEQPGCVHANMDLYKWAAKTMPWTGTALLLECFTLALELRDLDMKASPYDLAKWGLPPIRIETPEGRREYEKEQRRLAEKATALRKKLIATLQATLS